jgi:hypothetical protein
VFVSRQRLGDYVSATMRYGASVANWRAFNTKDEARAAGFPYMEASYDPRRRHSALAKRAQPKTRGRS